MSAWFPLDFRMYVLVWFTSSFSPSAKALAFSSVGEAGYVSIADRIFLSHTPVVFLTLCIGHFREVGFFSRWHNVQGIGKYISRTVRKR